MARVNARRRYDASGRLERAKQSREELIGIARRAFLRGGYAKTTVAAIARKAGVSVETVYKTFGGKPGLVRAICERGLQGRGAAPAEQRSDELSARENDPRAIVRHWGKLTAEVSPLVSPILLLVRSAAGTDADLAQLLAEHDEQRLARMRHNAEILASRGFLRDGVSVEQAADVMWTLTAPDFYDLVVVRRGWTPQQFGELVATTLSAAVLP
jgi:AcrR family transcriptional regulator